MLRTITDSKAIRAAQEIFTRRVEVASTGTEILQLGFQGGGLEAECYILPDQGIWFAISELESRYWNAVGLGNPLKDDRSIVVEVNPPRSGLDRRVSGLFLEDAAGNIHMAHRGRVGGGRKGIGKSAFQDWYPEPFTMVDDDGDSASVIVLGNIDDEHFLNQLADFTRRVAAFKREVTRPRQKSIRESTPLTTETGRTIVLISCSAGKSTRPAPAQDLYQGTLFKASLVWAQQQKPDAIYILSARHHLLEPDRVIEPYDLTLNDMPVDELRRWSATVVEQLKSAADIDRDRFIILAGDKYRRFVAPHLRNVELPLEGMRIGEQVQYLQHQVAVPEAIPAASEPADCAEIHRHLAALPRFQFPFDAAQLPKNGIYILFESGEHTHGTDRIVRIGTHRGKDQLQARLKEHFRTENKDRSIFRKNIGRALLARERSPLATQWELDLTTREARERHARSIDRAAMAKIEQRVSEYMRSSFSFCLLEVPEKSTRLRLEAGLIATVNRCAGCAPSRDWLGRFSPKPRIAQTGLWLVQGLDAEPLSKREWDSLKRSSAHDPAAMEFDVGARPTGRKTETRGRPKGSRRMSRKYAPLEEYLRTADKDKVTLTLNEIETILGQQLPRSAMDYRPWWSNPRQSRGLSQQSAWLNAGYVVESVSQGPNGWVQFRRISGAPPTISAVVKTDAKRQTATTHGGRKRDFKWWIDGDTLRIQNTEGLEHSYGLAEIVTVLEKIHQQFGRDWFPLANNVEKMYHGTEKPGLGTAIYNQSKSDTLHAQGASYLGVILEQAGILEWNNERRGIEWQLGLLPLSGSALARQLASAARIEGHV